MDPDLKYRLVIFSSTYRKGVQVSNEDESQLGPGQPNIQPRHVLQEPNTLPSYKLSMTVNSKIFISDVAATVHLHIKKNIINGDY